MVLVCAGSLAWVGCGSSEDDGLTCGAGTIEVDGVCVPDDDGLTCAQGTVEMDGECVPDGSVICEQGTTFNPADGTCEVDPDACAAGTVFVDGTCVPFDDTLKGDVSEGPENNDPTLGGTAGSLSLPEVGDTLTVDGCIVPTDFDGDSRTDADFDAWTFVATGPTLLDMTIDGTGGASAAFALVSTDETLAADGWQRIGVNLVSDGAQRQVFLPMAGTYVLQVTDARSLFFAEPAGHADACYFLQISHMAVPAPTPITADTITGDLGDAQFHSFTATDGQLVFNTLDAFANSARGSIVQMIDGQYAGSATDAGETASTVVSGLADGQEVVFVIDHVYNYAFDAVPFELAMQDADAQQAPGGVVLTHDDSLYRWIYFRADAGDVMHITTGSVDGLLLDLIDPGLTKLHGQVCDDCNAGDVWLQVQETGFHYMRVYNYDGVAGVDYALSVGIADVSPTPVTIDTAAAGDLTAEGMAVFELTTTDWLEYSVSGATGFTDARVTLYPRDGSGILGDTLASTDFGVSDGTPFGRIDLSGGTYLVTVQDNASGDTGSTFDLDVATKAYEDLGTVDVGTPITLGGESVGADETRYYLVRTISPGNVVTVTGTGGFDPVLSRLDNTETVLSSVNATGADSAETLEALWTTDFLAFAVTDAAGAAGSFDSGVVALRGLTAISAPGLPFGASPTSVTDSVTLTDTTACAVAGLAVDVDITHAWRGDLLVTLTHVPTGTTATLHNGTGGAADDLIGTYPLTLTPDDPGEFADLSALDDAEGEWRLDIEDTYPSLDHGVFNSWGVSVLCE